MVRLTDLRRVGLAVACVAALASSWVLPLGARSRESRRELPASNAAPALSRQSPEEDPDAAPPPPEEEQPPSDSEEVTGTEEGAEPPPEPPPILQEVPPPPKPAPPRPRKPATLQEKHDDVLKRMSSLAPRGVYLMIDTGTNRLYLMRNRCILREAVCSTGSGRFLPDPPRKREWTFDTPKGEFRIRRKVENPVWTKPDWAFIEDGEPIPKRDADRVTPDELGDYAMDLGDGYLIHGTLYERSLGMSVTHGCVRLGAKDLEAIFKAVRVGTPVYIF
ncbi:MAG TPA: L,D-transpeptidase [Candidatus Polarisedimenticolia bacterium]|nr:L,D-transpeptidase [Candidatus Polarisedimenticolia bacterium]